MEVDWVYIHSAPWNPGEETDPLGAPDTCRTSQGPDPALSLSFLSNWKKKKRFTFRFIVRIVPSKCYYSFLTDPLPENQSCLTPRGLLKAGPWQCPCAEHLLPPGSLAFPSTSVPSAESMLILGTGKGLYQHFCLLPTSSSSSVFPPALVFSMGSTENFPKEFYAYCFICKSQSLPKSGATHTQPNSSYVKKGFTRLDRQINKPLSKNPQANQLITLENRISNLRMSSIRSAMFMMS